MTSVVKLYKSIGFNRKQNFIVEHLDDYLGSLTDRTIEITNFQYQRHALFLRIKLNLPQSYQEFERIYGTQLRYLNYVSIKNENSNKVVYYFVKKIVQVAEQTIALDLEMDTLNTFTFNVDYVVSHKTLVQRKHKKRWQKVDSEYHPLIDRFDEGLQVPLFKIYSHDLKSELDLDWYLIYKTNTNATEDNPQAVECFLAPSNPIQALSKGKITITSGSLEAGKTYIFIVPTIAEPDKYKEISFVGGTIRTNQYVSGINEVQTYGFCFDIDPDDNTKVRISTLLFVNGSIAGVPYFRCDVLAVRSVASAVLTGSQTDISCDKANSVPQNVINVVDDYTFTPSDTSIMLNDISSVDRSDVLLLKIIAIPYLPTPYEFSSGILVFGNEWEYDGVTGLMKLTDLSIKFKSRIKTDSNNELKIDLLSTPSSVTDDPSDLTPDIKRQFWTDFLETKMLHSSFYLYKFVYDSFSYEFKLEDLFVSKAKDLDTHFEFTFVMTTTMNSKFMFMFDDILSYKQQDYDNILIVARNNEATIYNSPYLNYLRTSYNYDVKALKRGELTTTLSIFGQGASAGRAMASGNEAMAITGLFSGVSGIISSITALSQQYDNFHHKLDELKQQQVAVSGADDLDLLFAYSHNRAKIVKYEVVDKIYTYLLDLFYYYGYKCNDYEVPEHNTRVWFDYVQCILDVDNLAETSVYVPDDCLEDIKTKFSNGVTFMHKYNNQWDFTQEMNNVEVDYQDWTAF